MTCLECLKARQRVLHEVYADTCLGCGIRRLAYMGREERQKKLDLIQFAYGMRARTEATQLLREECARIKALKQANDAGKVTT